MINSPRSNGRHITPVTYIQGERSPSAMDTGQTEGYNSRNIARISSNNRITLGYYIGINNTRHEANTGVTGAFYNAIKRHNQSEDLLEIYFSEILYFFRNIFFVFYIFTPDHPHFRYNRVKNSGNFFESYPLPGRAESENEKSDFSKTGLKNDE